VARVDEGEVVEGVEVVVAVVVGAVSAAAAASGSVKATGWSRT